MIASLTLKEHGMAAEAEEMRNRIYSCGSYAEALDIISEYVESTLVIKRRLLESIVANQTNQRSRSRNRERRI